MTVSQAAFRAAVFDPDAPVPPGLIDHAGAPAGKRFDVYRNNVVASLVSALADAFPAVRGVVGAANFAVLAGAYVRAHPPAQPMLAEFGGALPGFLASFEPTRSLGYLPDLARVEIAIRESYHAGDASGIDPGALAVVAPEALGQMRLTFAPAVRLVRSDWPVVSVRRFTLEGGEPPRMAAEAALVTRPAFDPIVTPLDPAAAACCAALLAGTPLGAAHDAGCAASAAFDLSSLLGTLLAGHAITALHEDPSP